MRGGPSSLLRLASPRSGAPACALASQPMHPTHLVNECALQAHELERALYERRAAEGRQQRAAARGADAVEQQRREAAAAAAAALARRGLAVRGVQQHDALHAGGRGGRAWLRRHYLRVR